MMATRSHSRSASSIRWVVRNTVLPRSRMPRTSVQIARRACGSSPVVSSSRNTSSGSLMSASAMNSRCFCPPESVMNHALRFSASPSCSSSRSPSIGRAVERRPEVHRLAHLDALLQLRLLQLHADPLLQLVDVRDRIEPEHRDRARDPAGAPLRRTPSSWSCPRRWADQAEDLSLAHLERDLVDGDRRPIALPDPGDFDDGHAQCYSAACRFRRPKFD